MNNHGPNRKPDTSAADRKPPRAVSKARPCEVCGGDHKCSYTEDGLIFCGRCTGPQPGFINLGPARGGGPWNLYRREGDEPPRVTSKPTPKCPKDWDALAR